MELDIGNIFATSDTHGITESTLHRLDEQLTFAHSRITTGIEEREFGYASLALPEDTDTNAINAIVESIPADTVLTIGIGGSALGAQAITSSLEISGHYVLDNIDPAYTASVLDRISLDRTLINVVSRSGTTPETLANFLILMDSITDSSKTWEDRTVITTGESGPLAAVAQDMDIPQLSVPSGVPGRYSALSAVGLLPPAVLGADIDAILQGGLEAKKTMSPSLFTCPAYAYGAISSALEQRGITMNAMVPYVESLEPFAEWFAQLWAESLGKDGLGQTPIRALGVTDQHSQLQLYRAGRKDKLITLIRPRKRSDLTIPETEIDELAYLSNQSLHDVIDAEFEATEASLAAAGQPNVRIEFEQLTAHSIGSLLFNMELACIMYGELMGIETFTQPAVEWGKRAARELLTTDDRTESEFAPEKNRFIIDSTGN